MSQKSRKAVARTTSGEGPERAQSGRQYQASLIFTAGVLQSANEALEVVFPGTAFARKVQTNTRRFGKDTAICLFHRKCVQVIEALKKNMQLIRAVRTRNLPSSRVSIIVAVMSLNNAPVISFQRLF